MNPPYNRTEQTSNSKIQFAYALTEMRAEPNLMPAGVKRYSFQVPRSPSKPQASDEGAVRSFTAECPNNQPSTIPIAEADFEFRPLQAVPADSALTSDFELALEEVRERLETKTALLEEVLQRFDRSEHRFWGINE